MKSENIYDAITEIRDDQILEGEKPLSKQRPRRMVWLGSLAAALALVVLAAAIGLPALARRNPTDPTGITPTAAAPTGASPTEPLPVELLRCTLAAPEYPEMAPYANEMDYYTAAGFDDAGYEEARAAWDQDQRRLHYADRSYDALVAGSLEKTLPAFLAGGAGENRICSPLNVWLALSMLAETTQGSTRQELLDLLGAEAPEQLRQAAASLWKCNYSDDGRLTSLLANSLWLRDGTSYNPDTLATLARDYYAASFSGTMGAPEYDEAIRAWVNEQTGGLLQDAAQGIATQPETVLLLLSTIYYKAAWQDSFSAGNNRRDVFHGPDGDETVEYLCQQLLERQQLYLGAGFQALSKPLEGSGRMYFLLPEEGVSPEALLEKPEVVDFLCSEAGREATADQFCHVNLQVPKFDVSSDLDLIPGLEALGLHGVFHPETADFSPLTEESEGMYVSTVRHAARVMIDEEGCTGAAFTEIMVPETAEPEEPETVDFILDRPFLFVITNNEGLPLFVGTVNHPAAQP